MKMSTEKCTNQMCRENIIGEFKSNERIGSGFATGER